MRKTLWSKKFVMRTVPFLVLTFPLLAHVSGFCAVPSATRSCAQRLLASCDHRRTQLTQARRCARVRMSGLGDDTSVGKSKKAVLFVCLGNICRSPAAEAVFRSVVQKAGLQDSYHIESAGTGGGSPNWFLDNGFSYHEGDPADSRMTEVAKRRGVQLTSRSRPINPKDFDDFDFIVHMDDSNRMEITRAANHWKIPQDKMSKVRSMMSFAKQNTIKYVPDPYYGGPDGFEKVLDLLDDACQGLFEATEEHK